MYLACFIFTSLPIAVFSRYPGQCLVQSGESFKYVAEIKYTMEDHVRDNFLQPLHSIQNNELRQINVSKALVLVIVDRLACIRMHDITIDLLNIYSPNTLLAYHGADVALLLSCGHCF